MAAFNSAANGVWNAGPTWGSVNNPGTAGVDYPGTGDSATISTHAVSISNGMTANVGNSPTSATAAAEFVISSTGSLTIDAGGVFNCKTPWDVTAGGVITNNGTFNTDPSGQGTVTEYRARVGVSGTGKLVVGPGGIMTAPVGYAWYQASGAVSNAGQLDINGTASNYALVERMVRSADARGWLVGLNITSAGKFEASHCIFDGCDDISFTGSGTYAITWEWCVWRNSTSTQNFMLATSTVTKNIQHCTFDDDVNVSGGWGTATGIAPDECYFDGNFTLSGTGGYTGGGYNVKRSAVSTQSKPGPFQPASGGSIVSHEILWKDISYSNPQWGTLNGALAGARSISGLVFCFEGTDQNGDCSFPDTTDAVLTTYTDCLFVPNSNGGQPGTWCSQLGGGASPAHTIAYNHNTGVIANSTGTRGIVIGETQDSQAGRLASLKSNLAFAGASDPTSQFLVYIDASQVTNDPVAVAGVDYNWIVSANANSQAAVYSTGNGTATQTTPTAANDIYGEAPEFIDGSYRSMRSWAGWWGARIGASGDSTTTPGTASTAANARLLLLAMHDGTFGEADTATGIRLCVQWIRRGYIPTNEAGRGAGHDSLTPGMFGAWAPAVTTPTVAGSTASCTTNAADGTCYWVITQSATAPDWDRIIAGQDATGATVAAGFSGNQAVASTSIAIDISGASLGGGDYYIHVAHKSAGTEAALDDYLHTSEPVTSAAFQAAGGGNVSLMSMAVLRRRRLAA